MGFFKRLFSFRSKKTKKRPQIVHNVVAVENAVHDDEHEAAVGRLLRSSSTRFAVVHEVDYSTLPPLPHPINDVAQSPAKSTPNLPLTNLTRRGTYTVTVHRRRQLSTTEFPNANRDLNDDMFMTSDARSHDSNDTKDRHLHGLRSDPSVASLLEMYDEHGHISPQAFSNSPPSSPKEGRAQTRRSGSTLRQLLGVPRNSESPHDDTSSSEGDISWAERFLGETSSISSASSISLGMPLTPNGRVSRDLLPRDTPLDVTAVSSDLSMNTSDNPAISSMEVELSVNESQTHVNYSLDDNRPYIAIDPTTPQRASQVFGFLKEKRLSHTAISEEKLLPELPSAFSFTSDEISQYQDLVSHFSSDNSFDSTAERYDAPMPFHVHSDHPAGFHAPPRATPAVTNQHLDRQPVGSQRNQVEVIMTGPTKVIVTAPTPSSNRDLTSRIPRGPRSVSRRSSSSSTNSRQRRSTALNERSNSYLSSNPIDPFTPIVTRRKSHRRSASQSSAASCNVTRNVSKPKPSEVRTILGTLDKENGAGLWVASDLPSTPVRFALSSSMTGRPWIRPTVTPQVFQAPAGVATPSPVSSSEMSPVGRSLMFNLRQQRMMARELERERSRSVRAV